LLINERMGDAARYRILGELMRMASCCEQLGDQERSKEYLERAKALKNQQI